MKEMRSLRISCHKKSISSHILQMITYKLKLADQIQLAMSFYTALRLKMVFIFLKG